MSLRGWPIKFGEALERFPGEVLCEASAHGARAAGRAMMWRRSFAKSNIRVD